MQQYKCIIVEDEPLATGLLKNYIQRVGHLSLIGEFRDAICAGKFLQEQEADIMFLDIHLPELKGVDFLRTLTRKPFVILTTAYHEYAIEGFELNVTDYLLKPFSFDRFMLSVNRVTNQIVANKAVATGHAGTPTCLYLNIDRRKVRVNFEEILYIESSREYVKIHSSKGMFMSKMTTHELEQHLPKARFRRIHRSFIIAISKVESFSKEYVEISGKRIPIGGGYKKNISLINEN
ncbi:MAG: response regulator transcription factor [Sphingobacteriales bacterium]|nr:response regulator transcription factor [Sphingobacteriales bacterium]